MNRKGKSVNKNQASAQLNRYWNTRTESPRTSTTPGFFATKEDRDLRRRPKTPATDRPAEDLGAAKKKAITPSRNKRAAGPWKGGGPIPGLDERQEAGTTIELQPMFL